MQLLFHNICNNSFIIGIIYETGFYSVSGFNANFGWIICRTAVLPREQI